MRIIKNAYKVNGDVTTVYLRHKGEIIETIVDTENIPELLMMDVTWFAYKPTRLKGKCYVKANLPRVEGKRKVVYLHQLFCRTEMMVDHINRNPLDNRKSNLRPATPKENSLNRGRNIGGEEGISWDKINKRWKAYLYIGGRQKQIGRYIDIDDARNALTNAKIKFAS